MLIGGIELGTGMGGIGLLIVNVYETGKIGLFDQILGVESNGVRERVRRPPRFQVSFQVLRCLQRLLSCLEMKMMVLNLGDMMSRLRYQRTAVVERNYGNRVRLRINVRVMDLAQK